MTLLEMSVQYAENAERLRARIRELHRRIDDLTPLLRECRELAVLTARYYDRRYHKHERYTL